MHYGPGAETRVKSLTFGALIAFSAFAAGFSASTAQAAAVKEYGKPGEPVKLVIGYQPYYTESWSGVIMRDKKFYEKYLPKGSKVEFQIGLQGAIIVNGMLAGKQSTSATSATCRVSCRPVKPKCATFASSSVLGLGYDQCNIFVARTDAPDFKAPEEALKWLDGKTVAVPKGSCTDRFAQAVFKPRTSSRPNISTRISRSSPQASAPSNSTRR